MKNHVLESCLTCDVIFIIIYIILLSQIYYYRIKNYLAGFSGTLHDEFHNQITLWSDFSNNWARWCNQRMRYCCTIVEISVRISLKDISSHCKCYQNRLLSRPKCFHGKHYYDIFVFDAIFENNRKNITSFHCQRSL